eukprot:GHVP01068172.1.p1 GENE.GHVP01068172.1~~GHVP01068172.1.p1  ORF type:complete len:108 (+),score=14.18 GHVP01068172.1:103-426(+)
MILNEQKDSSEDVRKKFEVKKWCAVALWSWDITVEFCAICKNHIMDPCLSCNTQTPSASEAADPKKCTVAWGTCNHAFHNHCIDKWLVQHQRCPLDNQEWVFQSYDR